MQWLNDERLGSFEMLRKIKDFLKKWIAGQIVTPTQVISVYNQSAHLTDAQAQQMTLAVAKQLSRDVAPFWGLVPALEFVPRGKKATAGSSPCFILDVPDVSGALGYHDEGADGVAYIKIFCNPVFSSGGTAVTGSLSVSSVLSHEVLEMTGDSPANKWADSQTNQEFAMELCDACEDQSYDIDGVSVSNFLLPAFFDPKASRNSRLDFLGSLSTPFSMTKGGYQIVRSNTGEVSQIWGSHYPEWRKAAKIRNCQARRVKK